MQIQINLFSSAYRLLIIKCVCSVTIHLYAFNSTSPFTYFFDVISMGIMAFTVNVPITIAFSVEKSKTQQKKQKKKLNVSRDPKGTPKS